MLEIAIPGVNGGNFQDILAAGGFFVQGPYTGSLTSSASDNPLGRRPAYTGTSASPITTVVALPTSANGLNVQFRWRLGFDNSVAVSGWNVDTVSLITYSCASIDTDGDGLPDGYEAANGLNPGDPSDAALDSDGDGMTNLQEYQAGTDPRSPASVLRASVTIPAAGNPIINFPSVNGRTYVVEYKDSLTVAGWNLGAREHLPAQDP